MKAKTKLLGPCACLISTVLISTLLSPAVAQADWARYALVIGHNGSDDPKLAPLRYADDDAVKYAQLFGSVADETVLLTDLDEATRRVFGHVKAQPPTRAAVISELKRLRGKMAEARKRGDQPLLYFIYSGHGNYDQEGRGYVHLADGRFTTRDIYYEVLGPTESDNPHHVVLMVDACNAALLVNSRGSDRRRVKRTSLRLEDYPKAGVILSASSVGEVHEWGRYLSGIFSHELRSALLGAGDVDDDGAVTFAEAAAFVANANAEVRNEIYRLKPYVRPPLDLPNLPIVDVRAARFRARLRIDKQFKGKAHMLDAELIRHADFHKAPGYGFWLGIPGDSEVRLVTDAGELIVPASARGPLKLADLERVTGSMLSARGTDEYFEKRLFARAWSPATAREWIRDQYPRALEVERYEPVPWYNNGAAWSLAGTGVASLAVAGGFHLAAVGAHNDAVHSPWADEALRLNERATTQMTAAYALYGVGAAASIGSLVWFVLDRRYETSTYRPPLAVDVDPSGVKLRGTF
ncbi:MAG: hypothetical protein ACI9WU_005108 [Myxococcota bacterium]|jgi:hypothetical protein